MSQGGVDRSNRYSRLLPPAPPAKMNHAPTSHVLLGDRNVRAALSGDPQQQVVSGERPSLELAHQWIGDPRPVYKAWAAELIRRHHEPGVSWDRELIDALGDVSRVDPYYTPDSDEDKMRLAILDTLIQLHVRIPDSVGEALFSRYPAQALILMYGNGSPAVTVSAHIIDDSTSDESWLVAAQYLASAKRGPVELLQRLQIKGQVQVYDPKRGGGGGGGVFGGVPTQHFLRQLTSPGWPTFITYRLVTGWDAVPGGTLLLGSRYPVYYMREPHELSESRIHGDRNEYILEILAKTLQTKPESLGVVTHPVVQFQWTTAEQYRADMQTFVAGLQHRYAELISRLLRNNYLTLEESERCTLKLDIEVLDHRTDKSQSIPNVGVGDHLK